MLKKCVLSLVIGSSFAAHGFELIAHRGVHQNYHRKDLDNDTCTADRIEPTAHGFVENTTASIRKAFDLGASMVELDIHPTSERDAGKEDQMVVFHDWTLDCRTEARCNDGCNCENGTCVTHLQSLSYLKTLDLGYGYTFDGGKTFPLRGKYRGQMPTLEEALEVLLEYPDKKLTVNWKDRFPRTVDIFIRIVSRYPEEVRKRIYFEYYGQDTKRFTDLGIQESVYQGGGPVRACLKKYVLLGWSGYFPEECRNTQFFVPLRETLGRISKNLDSVKVTDVLWGWPHEFIERAHAHGTRIYVSQVDSEAELNQVIDLPIDGIMTNRIELIAPLMAKYKK